VKNPNKPYLNKRIRSSYFEPQQKEKLVKVMPAEYYLYTHFFGEDLHDTDDDYEGDNVSEAERGFYLKRQQSGRKLLREMGFLRLRILVWIVRGYLLSLFQNFWIFKRGFKLWIL